MVCALHDLSLHGDHPAEMLRAPDKIINKCYHRQATSWKLKRVNKFAREANLRIVLVVPTELRCKTSKLCFKRARSNWCSPRCP